MSSPVRDAPVVLALGTNLGDREAVLRSAVRALSRLPGLVMGRVSPVVETAPVGGPEQPDYLNAVLLASTSMSPRELLLACQQVEQDHDRVREVRWGPRTLDIDIITYGTTVQDDPLLTLPHPRAHQRSFVLTPWALADPEALLGGPRGDLVRELALVAADRDEVRLRPDMVLTS